MYGYPLKHNTRVYQQLLRSFTKDANDPSDIHPLHHETRMFSYMLFIQAIITGLSSCLIMKTTGNKESTAEWIICHYLCNAEIELMKRV
jgi:hypothetical protein